MFDMINSRQIPGKLLAVTFLCSFTKTTKEPHRNAERVRFHRRRMSETCNFFINPSISLKSVFLTVIPLQWQKKRNDSMREEGGRVREREINQGGEQTVGQGRKEWRSGTFLLIVGGSLASLGVQLLQVCCFRRERGHTVPWPHSNYCIPFEEYLQL